MAYRVFTEELSGKLLSVEPSKKEILRYMQSGGDPSDAERLIDQCIDECFKIIKARACFVELGVERVMDEFESLIIGGVKINSRDLMKNLSGCDKAIVFAVTVGIDIDRLTARYSAVSPVKALCVSAIGNERVEALCDIFCDDLKKKYKKIHKRFSPGYGDLSLSHQKDIFRLLDCPKNIGAFLSDSMLITPAKSVTAIVGVESGD